MLVRIRNAQMVGHTEVAMPASQLKASIAKVLKDEGYIEDFATRENGPKKELRIALKYYAGKPVIERLERVSKPGLRVYKGRDDIPKVMNGLGVAILSTSRGVYRKFGLGRNKLRDLAMKGEVPGVIKASW